MANPQHRKDTEPSATQTSPTPSSAPPPDAPPLPPEPKKPATTSAGGLLSSTKTALNDEYRPNRKVHLAAAGPVALDNWVGGVEGKVVRVYRGAQASGIPDVVKTAMGEANIRIGIITLEELGLRQAPASTLLR